jgi:hypothetical protein
MDCRVQLKLFQFAFADMVSSGECFEDSQRFVRLGDVKARRMLGDGPRNIIYKIFGQLQDFYETALD